MSQSLSIVIPAKNEAAALPGLLQRLLRLDSTRMPPLAHEALDPVAEAVVGGWIDQGAP